MDDSMLTPNDIKALVNKLSSKIMRRVSGPNKDKMANLDGTTMNFRYKNRLYSLIIYYINHKGSTYLLDLIENNDSYRFQFIIRAILKEPDLDRRSKRGILVGFAEPTGEKKESFDRRVSPVANRIDKSAADAEKHDANTNIPYPSAAPVAASVEEPVEEAGAEGGRRRTHKRHPKKRHNKRKTQSKRH